MNTPAFELAGTVVSVSPTEIRAILPNAAVNDVVEIIPAQSRSAPPRPIRALVVASGHTGCSLAPFAPVDNIQPGARAVARSSGLRIPLGRFLLGRAVGALGEPLSAQIGGPIIDSIPETAILGDAIPSPLERAPIDHQFRTGYRSIDLLNPVGEGQRLAVLAEPGVGKTTLLAQLTSLSWSEINVLALIGERGREVTEMLENPILAQAKSRTVFVVSTSDEPPIARVTAAATAARIAEYFRDAGHSVLMLVDSLSRYCRALRDLGFAAGEPAVRRGYPPSVFSALPRLLERAGATKRGTITAFYTVLTTAGLDEDPMVEEVKSLTDGHIVLRQELARRGYFPAVDPCASLSRLASRFTPRAYEADAALIRKLLARLAADRDFAALGGQPDPELRTALAVENDIYSFLSGPAPVERNPDAEWQNLHQLAQLISDRISSEERRQNEPTP